MNRAILEQLNDDRRTQRTVVLDTHLSSGAQKLLYPNQEKAEDVDDALFAAAREAASRDRAAVFDAPEGEHFLQVFNPPARMVIVGAVHIAQALAPMAALAGFEVFVVDPRRAFATAERFAGVTLAHEWPDEALDRLRPDHRTAVVTLTHDPKLDDPALATALRSPAFYIGSLGSRKTHAARLERLRAEGFGEDALARVQGPVGLPIGARSPAEIAVSIVAQVVQKLREGSARTGS